MKDQILVVTLFITAQAVVIQIPATVVFADWRLAAFECIVDIEEVE
jgi:hypothetical protein